jgi:hypothetical protein
MLGEDFSAEWIDFTEGDGSHSGPFEPKAKASDAAE